MPNLAFFFGIVGLPVRVMPILHPSNEIQIVSVASFDDEVAWLRRLLRKKGAVPPSGSTSNDLLAAAENLARAYRQQISLPFTENLLCNALGTAYVVKAIHRTIRKTARPFASHWKHFRGADICLTRDARRSEARDKVWEMVIASLCADFARAVDLREPDVRCEFRDVDWGIACKNLYSRSASHQINRIVEGAKQVEGSGSELGVVAVNATSLIDRNRFLGPMPGRSGEFFSFTDEEVPISLLVQLLQHIVSLVDRISLIRRLTRTVEGADRLKTRAVVFFAQAVTSVRGAPMILTALNHLAFRTLTVGEEEFLNRLNHAAQTVMIHTVARH